MVLVTPHCSGHHLEAALRTSHTPANPDRQFYCCPLDRSDPKRCNFFVWADSPPPADTPPSTPQKRSPEVHYTPEAKQKRRRLIEDAIQQPMSPSSNRPSSPLDEDERSQLHTPPPTTSRRGRNFSPEPSPTISKGKEKARADFFIDNPEFTVQSTVDHTISQEVASIRSSLAELEPQIRLLERKKSAGDKINEHTTKVIKQLEQENQELKNTLAVLTMENQELKAKIKNPGN